MEQARALPTSSKYRRGAFSVFAMFGLWAMVVAFASSKRPISLGVAEGRLAELPGTPNCVSSQTTDPEKRVAPIPWQGSSEEALELLVRVVNQCPRARIVRRTGDYLHAEFRSLLFRFVDDVEFFVNQRDQQIELRSASRLGYSDLGANRKRVERFRAQFLALGPRPKAKSSERKAPRELE